jgi:hypothetical protein
VELIDKIEYRYLEHEEEGHIFQYEYPVIILRKKYLSQQEEGDDQYQKSNDDYPQPIPVFIGKEEISLPVQGICNDFRDVSM